jgi:hypothetical protein
MPDAAPTRGAGPAGKADDTELPGGATAEQRGLQEGDEDAGTRRATDDESEPTDTAKRRSDESDAEDSSAAEGVSSGEEGSDKTDASKGAAEGQAADDDRAVEGKGAGEEGAAGAVQLSTEQRTQVKEAFAGHKTEAKVDLDVDVAVGVALPRRVHLVAIPEDVIVIVPAWRRYRYFIVDDVLCIVDPDTYLIVEVILLA